jgi:hypothetical protein
VVVGSHIEVDAVFVVPVPLCCDVGDAVVEEDEVDDDADADDDESEFFVSVIVVDNGEVLLIIALPFG